MQLVQGCLVASVQVELSPEVLHVFQQDLLEAVRRTRARATVLDLSGVSILDSRDFRSIERTLEMASLLGAQPLLVGIRPGIAASLSELGAQCAGFAAFSTLERALEHLDSAG